MKNIQLYLFRKLKYVKRCCKLPEMEIASQSGLKAPTKCKTPTVIGIISLRTKNICFFIIILETAHGTHFYLVPSQFYISGALDISFSQDDIDCKFGFKISFKYYGLNSISVLCIQNIYIYTFLWSTL